MWKRNRSLDVTTATIKSARRVFAILELFDALRRPLTLKEICRDLDFPTSSGAALLKSLVVLGYLDYDRASRTYLPTMRIAVLGQWAPEALFGEAGLLELMREVRSQTGETVILAARSDLLAQYLHVLRSDEPLHYGPAPGSVRPLARCGAGRLLMSAESDEAIDLLARRINAAAEAPDERIDLAELMADIAVIRHQRHVFSRHLFTEGVGFLGVLAPPSPHGRRLALGVGGPLARLQARYADHLATLRGAAEALEAGAI